jgi:WhiB family redox-sensing transcriptional regulator
VAGTRGTGSKTADREQWLDDGACREEDPELFFPITSSGPAARQIAAAKAVCQRCGVQSECLHYALESHQSHGVWGGTSEEERLRMTLARAGTRAACTPSDRSGRPADDEGSHPRPVRAASRPASGARRPSRRLKSGREGRNAGYRA